MHVTHLSGVVNTIVPGQTDITLHSIDRRRAGVFDFSGRSIIDYTDVRSALGVGWGKYDVDTNVLTAHKLGIFLLQP